MSLRLRLLLATVTAAVLGLAVVVSTTYIAFGRSQIRQVDDAIDRVHPPIEKLAELGTPIAWNAIAQVAPGFYVAVLDAESEIVFVSEGRRPGDDDFVVDLSQIGDQPKFKTLSRDDQDGVRVRIDPLRNGSTLVIGESLHEQQEIRSRLLSVLLFASTVAIALVIALSWLLLQLGLRPLREVEQSAAAITDRDLSDVRVPGSNKATEVGSLASALNSMLDRLDVARSEREQTMVELVTSEMRMRQFVADASHELRTPIAAAGAYAELFEQGARNRPEDLERSMAGISRETKRMSRLVNDLLLLARLDDDRPKQASTVDLTELIFHSADAARTIDPEHPVQVSVDGVVTVPGDPTQLRQVVDNLLANVRAHTPAGTSCLVSLSVEEDEAVIRVSDEGPGVSDEQLAQLTNRFYRVDSARSRSTGGSGLGLSIVESIVTAHGGSIRPGHNTPTGLSVAVRLPGAAADRNENPA